VWTKYKTKRFPLPLNSIAPSLDGVHEKKSPKLIMTYVGSCDGKSGELCWIYWSSIAVLKEKKNIMSTPNVQCGHNIRQKDSHYH